MYERFYGFRDKPFSIIPNPDLLYLSSKHRLALTYLEYGLMEGSGFILLTGEIGIGKTTLIRHLLGKVNKDFEVAVIFNTNVTADQLLRLIVQEIEAGEPAADKSANLDLINARLIDLFARGKHALLIVDEAQNLSREALEEVRLLSNLQTESQPLVQIALVGQPELQAKIADPSLEQLAQRITVSYHLGALSLEETREYIAYRLEQAGGRTDIFPAEVVERIHELSGGIPRMINILCDTSLVYAYADEAEAVSLETVETVVSDRQDRGLFSRRDLAGPDAPLASPPFAGAATSVLVPGEVADLQERMRTLEATVTRLSVMVDGLGREFQSRTAQAGDVVAQKLESMLQLERAKYDKLLVQYGRVVGELRSSREARRQAESGDPDGGDAVGTVGPGGAGDGDKAEPDRSGERFSAGNLLRMFGRRSKG